MREKTKDGPAGLKITVQYRIKGGKVYELTNREAVLAVHILRPDEVDELGKWHVEARIGAGVGPSLADGWGATATEALGETARAWTSRTPSLAVFDWEAVTRELRNVHAV